MSGIETGALLAAAAAAGGTALNYQAERQASKQRRNILNRSFEDTSKATDKATQLLTNEGQNYQGERRQDAFNAQETAAFEQARKDMEGQGATGATLPTAGDRGNVSGDFIKAKADRALTEGDRMTSIARELAKTRAPGMALQNEGIRGAETMQRTGSIFNTARNKAGAAQMDAANVEAPWYGTLGKIAQMAAMAYLSGGAGAGAAGSGAGYGLTGAQLGSNAAAGSGFWPRVAFGG